MSSQRAQRVAESIQKEISTMLISGLKDPRIGFVTITSVDVTADLRQAKVYFTVIGDESARSESEAGLKSSASYIRQQLGRLLHLKHIPEVQFVYDASVEYGNRIEKLLRDVKAGDDDV